MLSIVTGTLNRINLLPELISNTVDSNPLIELVLVDGGSSDGTIEYIKSLDHKRIKFIERGKRSYYWDYMNIGIEKSSYEWVCQWNDDVILETGWDNIIAELSQKVTKDFYIFSWKENSDYVIIENDQELVMNYGIYHKRIFREIGMYDSSYKYYFCDGDMSYRAKQFGYSYSKMYEVKCNSLTRGDDQKKAYMEDYQFELDNYMKKLEMYRQIELPGSNIKLQS